MKNLLSVITFTLFLLSYSTYSNHFAQYVSNKAYLEYYRDVILPDNSVMVWREYDFRDLKGRREMYDGIVNNLLRESIYRYKSASFISGELKRLYILGFGAIGRDPENIVTPGRGKREKMVVPYHSRSAMLEVLKSNRDIDPYVRDHLRALIRNFSLEAARHVEDEMRKLMQLSERLRHVGEKAGVENVLTREVIARVALFKKVMAEYEIAIYDTFDVADYIKIYRDAIDDFLEYHNEIMFKMSASSRFSGGTWQYHTETVRDALILHNDGTVNWVNQTLQYGSFGKASKDDEPDFKDQITGKGEWQQFGNIVVARVAASSKDQQNMKIYFKGVLADNKVLVTSYTGLGWTTAIWTMK